jgi:hypothetical protein
MRSENLSGRVDDGDHVVRTVEQVAEPRQLSHHLPPFCDIERCCDKTWPGGVGDDGDMGVHPAFCAAGPDDALFEFAAGRDSVADPPADLGRKSPVLGMEEFGDIDADLLLRRSPCLVGECLIASQNRAVGVEDRQTNGCNLQCRVEQSLGEVFGRDVGERDHQSVGVVWLWNARNSEHDAFSIRPAPSDDLSENRFAGGAGADWGQRAECQWCAVRVVHAPIDALPTLGHLRSGQSENSFGGGIGAMDSASIVRKQHSLLERVQRNAGDLLASAQCDQEILLGSSLELEFDEGGDVLQRLALGRVEDARFAVDDAEGADSKPVRTVQRLTGIEPNLRIAGHQRIVRESLVRPSVFHHERLVGLGDDRMRAEREVSRRLPDLEPESRFEPLSIAVDDRYQGNRCIEDGRCQRGQPVIAFFCLCVENAQASHRFQSMLFIRMRFGWLHIDSSTALMKT